MDRQRHVATQIPDENQRNKYLEGVGDILSKRKENDSAPYMVYCFDRLLEKFHGKNESFTQVKKEYNDLVLSMEEDLYKEIISTSDSLKKALIYSRIGNYIDFGAVSSVDTKEFLALFDRKEELDEHVYNEFIDKCNKGKTFVLLCDNCGEIVVDKILVKILKEKFPHLDIYVMVRGADVINDATIEDAQYCGLDKVAKVVSNGIGVAGTILDMISIEARELLESADVILAKGQGNFETLSNNGLEVFFSFLCKCENFVEQFKVDLYTGMFIHKKPYL